MANSQKRRRNRRNRSRAKNLQDAVCALIEFGVPTSQIAVTLKLTESDVREIDDSKPILDRLDDFEERARMALLYSLYAKLVVESWPQGSLPIKQHLIQSVLYEHLRIREVRLHLLRRLERAEAETSSQPSNIGLLKAKAKECLQICYIRISKREIGSPSSHSEFLWLAEQQCDWLIRLERAKQNRKASRAPGS